jgi:hypothetical protein
MHPVPPIPVHRFAGLDEALEKLRSDARKACAMELKFFGGLEMGETPEF